MTGVRPGFPEDLGDWSVGRVCYESTRLMLKHFGDMLRVALLFTFPASMIKVWHIQFHPHEIQESIWTELFVNVLDGLVAQLLFISGFVVMLEVLRDRMYPEDGCPKTFFNAMKHAYRKPKKALTDSENPLLNEAPTTPDPTQPPIPIDKLLKAFGLFFLFFALYCRLWTTGEYFTPQAVAEMGLPPWTVFMFTALAGAYTGLSTSYFHLTFLLLCSWADAPRSTPPELNPVVRVAVTYMSPSGWSPSVIFSYMQVMCRVSNDVLYIVVMRNLLFRVLLIHNIIEEIVITWK